VATWLAPFPPHPAAKLGEGEKEPDGHLPAKLGEGGKERARWPTSSKAGGRRTVHKKLQRGS